MQLVDSWAVMMAALMAEMTVAKKASWTAEHLGSELAAQKDGCMVGDSVGHCLLGHQLK